METWRQRYVTAASEKVAALHFNSKDKTVMCFLFVTGNMKHFKAFLFLFLRIVKPESGTLFFSAYNLDD